MKLPPYRQVRTGGDTDVVAVDWAGAEFTELRLVLPSVRAGRREALLAGLLGRLIPLGPMDRNAAGHEERLLGHGVGVRSASGVDRLTVAATVPRDELDWALGELLERVGDPVYTATGVTEAVHAEAVARTRAAGQRETLMHRALSRARWGPGHPWAAGLPPSDGADLDDVGPDDLAAFARRHLTLEQATVMVVGDLGTDGGRRWSRVLGPLLDRVEAADARTSAAAPRPADPGPRGVPPLVLPVAGTDPTASLRLWAPALPRQDSGHPALHVLAMVVGGYFGSRLNQELRERRGDVYGVTTGFEVLATAATFAVALETPVDRWEAVHATVLDTVAELRRTGPTAAELHAAVRWSANAVTVGMGSPAALASAGSSVVFCGDTLGLWDRQAAAAAVLTPADVAAAGERHLTSGALLDLVAVPPGRVRNGQRCRVDDGA